MAKTRKVKEEISTVAPEVTKEEKFFDLREVSKEIAAAEKEKEPEPIKPAVPPKAIIRREMDANLPFDERILAFLESKSGTIRLNDFLKALYPIPRMNEIPKWAAQAESKLLKKTLEDMVQAGHIVIANGMHKKLGSPYYTGDDQRLMHHNIATVNINVVL